MHPHTSVRQFVAMMLMIIIYRMRPYQILAVVMYVPILFTVRSDLDQPASGKRHAATASAPARPVLPDRVEKTGERQRRIQRFAVPVPYSSPSLEGGVEGDRKGEAVVEGS